MFGNLAKIVTAPLKIVDAVVVKPIADLAEDVVDAFEGDRRP